MEWTIKRQSRLYVYSNITEHCRLDKFAFHYLDEEQFKKEMQFSNIFCEMRSGKINLNWKKLAYWNAE